jgi:hypothetical protein
VSFWYSAGMAHLYKYLIIHSTVAWNAPSLPALTLGSLMSPRTAKPCLQPSKYSRLYPGAKPAKTLSAVACASRGNISSVVQPLMSSGAFAVATYFCASKQGRGRGGNTYLEIDRDLEERRVRGGRCGNDAVEREIKDVAAAEAIAHRTEGSDPLGFERGDDLVERRAGAVGAVVDEPLSNVEIPLYIGSVPRFIA